MKGYVFILGTRQMSLRKKRVPVEKDKDNLQMKERKRAKTQSLKAEIALGVFAFLFHTSFICFHLLHLLLRVFLCLLLLPRP